ncbi:MAG: hypothetical protein R6U50_05835 [Desulfobacterales bacterium]
MYILKNRGLMSIEKREILRRWAALGFGITVIVFFMYCLGPKLEQVPPLSPFFCVIDERNIDVGTYFYTDNELFSEAQLNIAAAMNFPPDP